MDFTKLNELLATLPGYALLTTSMKTVALQASLIPDSEGRWPGDTDYEATYDIYFAALSLLPFLQAQPVVTSAGSEGTSISVKPMDWEAIRVFYRGQSVIVSGQQHVITSVAIPDVPHVKRVPMNDRGGYFGDIDTDVN